MILDDVLTGLDRATERHITDAVFGPNGLLEKLNSTVILATNSGIPSILTLMYNMLTYESTPFELCQPLHIPR
jgi:hypothetical protein